MQLFTRLKARGYTTKPLLPIFTEAVIKSKTTREKKKKIVQTFAKIRYDPNGPTQRQLAQLLEFDTLKPLLNELEVEKATIYYLKPASLRNLLCPI